jgi:uncharacterized membrane protein
MINLSKKRPSVWLAALCAVVPWLVLISGVACAAWADGSTATAVLRRSSTGGAALLAALASAFAVAFAIWARSARGRSVAEALGAHCNWLMLGCSFVLWCAAFFMILDDGRLDTIGNASITASLVALMWLLGSASQRVPRNRLLGFRTRRTLADDATWRSVNTRHGGRLRAAAFFGMVGVITPPYGPLVALLPAVMVGLFFLAEEVRAASPE